MIKPLQWVILLAILVSCGRRPKVLFIRTDMGTLTLRIEPKYAVHALHLAGDSCMVDQILQDGFLRLSTSAPASEPAGSDLPLSHSFVLSGGRYYIVQGRKYSDAAIDKWEQLNGVKLSRSEREKYKNPGGTLAFEGKCTVLGQLIDGQEVLDRIAALPNDADGRPLRHLQCQFEQKGQ